MVNSRSLVSRPSGNVREFFLRTVGILVVKLRLSEYFCLHNDSRTESRKYYLYLLNSKLVE